MKYKNVKHYGTPERLAFLKDEMDFIGRYSEIHGDHLVVFAVDPKHGKKRKEQERKTRDKREEKFQRRNKSDE